MNKKIISYVLLNSLLVQIIFTSLGCHAFYSPNDDKDLEENINSKERILLKLKDQSQLDLESESYLFVNKSSEFIYGIAAKLDFSRNKESRYVASIPKAEIVSLKEILIFNLTTYERYLLKDSTSITFEKGKMYTATPDSGREYWIVLDHEKNELRKINNSDIEEIQVIEINWITTSVLLAVVIGFIAMAIAASQFSGGISGGGSF
jgi:hypothetical protein